MADDFAELGAVNTCGGGAELGKVIADLPGLLSRRADPRHGMSLVWGAVQAGVAPNTIPQSGMLTGTVRMLDRNAWDGAEDMIRGLVGEVVAPTGAQYTSDAHAPLASVTSEFAPVLSAPPGRNTYTPTPVRVTVVPSVTFIAPPLE